MLQRVTVITLVLCSHISLCAGSLFSVSMALASHIATSDHGVVMTPDAHTPLCMLATPKTKEGTSTADGGCGGGKKCSQTTSAVSFSPPQSSPNPLISAVFALLPVHTERADNARREMRNSAGPPGEHYGLLIASVVRRE